MNNSFNDLRAAVVGIGGVGGYIAAMLCKHDKHITLAARGSRKESLSQNGISMKSEMHGSFTAYPEKVTETSDIGPQDIIFICVKGFSVEQVCNELKEQVAASTIIVPVMNGVDNAEKIRKAFPKNIVLDSLIYISAFANEDFSISQVGTIAPLYMGTTVNDERHKAAVHTVNAFLNEVGIDCQIPADIEAETWNKYILNCSQNVITAYYDCDTGHIRENPERTAQFETLMDEAWNVAKAKNINVTQADIDELMRKFRYVFPATSTTSLQRDFHDGKPTELEMFSGYIIKEADRLNVPVPLTKELYTQLLKRI